MGSSTLAAACHMPSRPYWNCNSLTSLSISTCWSREGLPRPAVGFLQGPLLQPEHSRQISLPTGSRPHLGHSCLKSCRGSRSHPRSRKPLLCPAQATLTVPVSFQPHNSPLLSDSQ